MPAEERALTSGVLVKEGRSGDLTMSLTTPSKLRELQIKLYRKAKSEPQVQSRGISRDGASFVSLR